MVEGASLESLYVGNCIEGSNPFLSARKALPSGSAFLLAGRYGTKVFPKNGLVKKDILPYDEAQQEEGGRDFIWECVLLKKYRKP